MNYFTQTDDFFKGIVSGVGEWIKDIIQSPKALITIVKQLISGELSVNKLIKAGLEGMVEDVVYIAKHKSVFNPFKKVSNSEVKEIGKHTGKLIADVASAIIAGKLVSSFSKTKIGKKIISKSKKIKNSNKNTKSTPKTTKTKKPSENSGPGCFVAGTQIITMYGSKNIEDIQIGDYVLAENPETGEIDYKEVVRTFVRYKDTTIHVIANGTEIETTSEHPFWVEGKGFIKAGYLQKGDILHLSSGTEATVEYIWIEVHEEDVVVYNFEVADFHTYFVSELGVLVHNSCGAWNGKVTAGKKFKDHFIRHKGLLQELTGKKYPKFNLTEMNF